MRSPSSMTFVQGTSTKSAAPGATCPACRTEGLTRRTDLTYETTNGLTAVVVANLEGVSCQGCGRSWFTPTSANIIRKHTGDARPSGDYEVRVTRISGSSLGLYLPKDLVRVMKLEAGMVGFAMPVDNGRFAISFEKKAEETNHPVDSDLLLL